MTLGGFKVIIRRGGLNFRLIPVLEPCDPTMTISQAVAADGTPRIRQEPTMAQVRKIS